MTAPTERLDRFFVTPVPPGNRWAVIDRESGRSEGPFEDLEAAYGVCRQRRAQAAGAVRLAGDVLGGDC